MLENWVQTLDFSIDSFRIQSDTHFYGTYYVKSTFYSRDYFKNQRHTKQGGYLNRGSQHAYTDLYHRDVILGSITMSKCDDNKIKIIISATEKISSIGSHVFGNDSDVLLLECDWSLPEYDENNEFVKYFLEMINIAL